MKNELFKSRFCVFFILKQMNKSIFWLTKNRMIPWGGVKLAFVHLFYQIRFNHFAWTNLDTTPLMIANNSQNLSCIDGQGCSRAGGTQLALSKRTNVWQEIEQRGLSSLLLCNEQVSASIPPKFNDLWLTEIAEFRGHPQNGSMGRVERNQTFKLRTSIHSMGDFNLKTIHVL